MSNFGIKPPGLNDEQISLLQAFIDNAALGEQEAMSLIPEEYREYFSTPTLHGQYFKAAVEQGRFKGIRLGRFDMGSKHYWYDLTTK